jgi:protein ImuB
VEALAGRLLDRLEERGVPSRAGVAAVPVAAELAARWGSPREAGGGPTPFLVKERTGWGWRRGEVGLDRSRDGQEPPNPPASTADPPAAADPRVAVVPKGAERAWISALPLVALVSDERLRALLDGVGVTTLGALAGLEREALEVRFGPEAVRLWRLARADDRRLLFERVPPERPHGSIDFVDYVLTDPSRLLFTANALLGPICERLVARGEHARTVRLVLPLADRSEWERAIRPARPTASRETWLRLVRGLLERLTVPDAVVGMHLEVLSAEPAAVHQGDLFDRGFATASAVEAAVARLAERQPDVLVRLRSDAHPLVERRSEWEPTGDVEAVHPLPGGSGAGTTETSRRHGLTLQLLPEPRRIRVETTTRRDHALPARLLDRVVWRDVITAAGPDRISGGQWENALYAREYYRCITEEGTPLWIYRDGREGSWYLAGYWD